jgi:hypothetical protein
MAKPKEDTPLASAAAALDAEVRKYADLADQIARAPLTSEKAIERVTRAVADAVEGEKRVLEALRALVETINEARDRQARSTEILNERGAVIAQKRTELELILVRFRNIGTIAKGLSEAMQKVTTYKPDPYDPTGAELVRETLAKIESGITECAKHAEEVGVDAQKRDFEDVARQADGLRQQLLATKNRLALLQKQMVS